MSIVKLLGLGKRQLHTTISRETIKPSSPTPSHLQTYHAIFSRETIKPFIRTPPHLQTYNLSLLDQCAQHRYLPLLLLYPNNNNFSLSANEKANAMKKSLSKSLTEYYPFAGRLHTPRAPSYVDCNDEGVVFVEATNDRQLEAFQRTNEHDGSLDELFPDGLVCGNSPGNRSLVGVQVNHFACGGMAVGVSMSHIIGDGSTLASFLQHWASVARNGSAEHQEVLPFTPHYIQSPRINSFLPEAEAKAKAEAEAPPVINQGYGNRVVRKFVFPNTKLNDLKNKVISLAESGSTPPTRVEVLTSLLYKTAIAAATTKSGCFKPSYLIMPVDIRNKFVQKLPVTTFGNVVTPIMIPTRHESETSLNVTVAAIKKEKARLDTGFESVEYAAGNLRLMFSKLGKEDLEDVVKRSYSCSSLCGFPYTKVDFGWGKPMGSTLALRSSGLIGFNLKDTPNGDGIEALVILEKKDMEIFQNDKEMLSFCQFHQF